MHMIIIKLAVYVLVGGVAAILKFRKVDLRTEPKENGGHFACDTVEPLSI